MKRLLSLLALAALAAGIVVARAGDAFWGTPEMLTLGFTFLAAGFAAVVFLAVALPEGSPLPRLLSWRPLRAAGEVSYAIYVFHWPVVSVLHGAGIRPATIAPGALGWAVWIPGVVAAVSLLAAISWTLLERPCLALKDRFEYRATGPAPREG